MAATKDYKQKNRLFNGFQYLSMNDATTLSNLSGLDSIVIEFNISENSIVNVNHALLNFTNSITSIIYPRFQVFTLNTTQSIIVYDGALSGGARLNFNTTTPILKKGDIVKFIIGDGNNRILLNNVDYGQNFNFGDVSSKIFTNDGVSSMFIGKGLDGSVILNFKGNINSLSIKLIDELTTYYSNTNNTRRILTASATTVKI